MSTSARMLRLLSLLQTHRFWPGDELATRLEVSGRTVRRDVERLRELGYDVDAVRGVSGGYQLRAGAALPPLLLEDEEAVAVAAALRAAAGGAVGGMEEVAVQALSKVVVLMPPRLRRRMEALTTQTDSPEPWRPERRPGAPAAPVLDAAVLTTLAQACRDHEPLRLTYAARSSAAGQGPAERSVEPHRLVSLGRRWYLVAYDRDRHDWRSFRVDRVSDPRPTGQRFRPREVPGGDALAFVRSGIRAIPRRHDVRVVVRLPADDVRRAVGRWGEVDDLADGAGGAGDGGAGEPACRLRMAVDELDWPVMVLAQLGAPFEVEGPAELADRVAEVAARFAASAR